MLASGAQSWCTPPPPRLPTSADFADLFCRFFGFLNFANLFC